MLASRLHLFLALALAALSFGPARSPAAEPRVRRNVEIEWEAVDGASRFEIKIQRVGKEKSKPMFVQLREPRWSATVAPGQYQMQIRSYDERGVPGTWSPPSPLEVKLPAIIVKSPAPAQTIPAHDDAKDVVHFEWEPVPGAQRYTLNAQTSDGEWKEELSCPSHACELRVPVGREIRWNAVAIDVNETKGDEATTPYAFELKGPPLAAPSIDRPISKLLDEMRWSEVDRATTYDVELSRRDPDTRKWIVVEKHANVCDTRLPIDFKLPTGRYRLTVEARAPHRANSPRATLSFERLGGYRDEYEFEAARRREGWTKPSPFYFITSYMISQISYVGSNYDDNSAVTFKALGGTGRVGAGYQLPQSRWGGFGIVDLSGFVIKGQSFKFASLEGHVTRKLEFGQAGVLLAGAGLFAKELPIVKGTPVAGYENTDKVRNIGPHAGLTYWMPLSPRYGLQMNARLYANIAGSSSGGQAVKTSMAYQYGLLGTYRLTPRWMGFAGYAYRHDEAKYAARSDASSFAQPGQVNAVTIEGHFLNVLLEYSF